MSACGRPQVTGPEKRLSIRNDSKEFLGLRSANNNCSSKNGKNTSRPKQLNRADMNLEQAVFSFL